MVSFVLAKSLRPLSGTIIFYWNLLKYGIILSYYSDNYVNIVLINLKSIALIKTLGELLNSSNLFIFKQTNK